MTRSKRAKMDATSPECECGASEQTLFHLLWECERSEPPEPSLRFYHALPHAQSVSHLLPKGTSAKDVTLWKMSCQRAIRIVKTMTGNARTDTHGHMRKDKDDQGHAVATTGDGSYVCCMRCYISRRARDAHWILLKNCTHAENTPVGEGGNKTIEGHAAALVISEWKTSVKRPQWLCEVCVGTECGQMSSSGDPAQGLDARMLYMRGGNSHILPRGGTKHLASMLSCTPIALSLCVYLLCAFAVCMHMVFYFLLCNRDHPRDKAWRCSDSHRGTLPVTESKIRVS